MYQYFDRSHRHCVLAFVPMKMIIIMNYKMIIIMNNVLFENTQKREKLVGRGVTNPTLM